MSKVCEDTTVAHFSDEHEYFQKSYHLSHSEALDVFLAGGELLSQCSVALNLLFGTGCVEGRIGSHIVHPDNTDVFAYFWCLLENSPPSHNSQQLIVGLETEQACVMFPSLQGSLEKT